MPIIILRFVFYILVKHSFPLNQAYMAFLKHLRKRTNKFHQLLRILIFPSIVYAIIWVWVKSW